MKKLERIILAALLGVSLCACSSTNKNEDSSDSLEESSSEQNITEEAVLDLTRYEPSTIEETVVYDANDIKITVTSLDEEGNLYLSVENNSSKNIKVNSERFMVNDLMSDEYVNIEVMRHESAGQTINLFDDLNNEYLDDYIITCISKIEFSLRIEDKMSYDVIDQTDLITIQTSAADYVQEFDQSGEKIVDYNGIQIYIRKCEKTDNEAIAYFNLLVINNSDQEICVDPFSDLSGGDGWVYTSPYDVYDILPHKVYSDNIDLWATTDNQNYKEGIKEVQCTIRIDDFDGNELYRTGEITVEFE